MRLNRKRGRGGTYRTMPIVPSALTWYRKIELEREIHAAQKKEERGAYATLERGSAALIARVAPRLDVARTTLFAPSRALFSPTASTS